MGRIALKTVTASELFEKVGGLSNVGKMPWFSYSIPTSSCITGGKLRNIEGSTCEGCYAHKRGNYRFDNVQRALRVREKKLRQDPDGWSRNMARLLRRLATKFRPDGPADRPAFRWHDSGDLQGVWHLEAIVRVANWTRSVTLADGSKTSIRHWLPTRESNFVTQFVRGGGKIPRNLTIRLSATMVDGQPPLGAAKNLGRGVTVSGVHAGEAPAEAYVCPAPKQGNSCGSCRTCWSRKAEWVSYHKH